MRGNEIREMEVQRSDYFGSFGYGEDITFYSAYNKKQLEGSSRGEI